jgi:hypothetical protein
VDNDEERMFVCAGEQMDKSRGRDHGKVYPRRSTSRPRRPPLEHQRPTREETFSP